MAYKEEDLFITPTNSIREARGSALGLEGNLSLYIIAAILGTIYMCYHGVENGWTPTDYITYIPIPLIVTILYLVFFKIGKPPGYQEDLIHSFIEGVNDDTKLEKENPYLKLKNKHKVERCHTSKQDISLKIN